MDKPYTSDRAIDTGKLTRAVRFVQEFLTSIVEREAEQEINSKENKDYLPSSYNLPTGAITGDFSLEQ